EKIDAPQRAKTGEPFDATAKIRSNVETKATVKLYENQFLVAQRELTLKQGENSVFTLLEREFALRDEELIFVKFHRCLRFDVAPDFRRRVEWLACFRALRRIDFFDEHLRLLRVAQRNGINLDAALRQCLRGFERVAPGFLSVAQQHDPFHRIRRKSGAGEGQRVAEVGRVSLRKTRPFFIEPQTRSRRLQNERVLRETNNSGGCATLLRQSRADVIARRFLRVSRNARRLIDDKEHRERSRVHAQSCAAERHREREQNERAYRETDAPLISRQIGERAPQRPREPRQRDEQNEKPGMRKLDHSVNRR